VLVAAGLGVVAIVVAGALVLGGFGSNGSGTAAATATPRSSAAAVAAVPLPPDIDPTAAAARWESGAVLLDVREPSEWNAGHVPGAEHIPLGELAARVDELPADTEILVICRSGNRSQQGRDILAAAGIERVTSVNGGVRAWRDAGLPYEGDVI
jgi:rhodanese-related sulfurtransferase